ncbi:MAG: branched-chain amino acid ABC transporter permease [Bdellovibrionota bacterium]
MAVPKKLPNGAGLLIAFVSLVAFDRGFSLLDNAYLNQVLILAGINIVLAVSLNLINGFTGQFSIGHAGFMAIGAYVSAAASVYLSVPFFSFVENSLGWPIAAGQLLFFPFLLALGGLAAALAGFLVGFPVLRLRGDYLAIATLGFGEIIRVLILNVEAVGGARGLSVASPDPRYDIRYEGLFAVFGIVVLTVWALARLSYSIRGRAYLAVRDDEVAAESIGVSAARIKSEAFVISSFFAGLAGVLFAQSQGYVHTNSFTFLRSIEAIAFVVLGGMGSITGCILAAVALTVAPEVLRPVAEYRMVAYAFILIAMMLLRPGGLLGMKEFSWGWFFRRKEKPS